MPDCPNSRESASVASVATDEFEIASVSPRRAVGLGRVSTGWRGGSTGGRGGSPGWRRVGGGVVTR